MPPKKDSTASNSSNNTESLTTTSTNATSATAVTTTSTATTSTNAATTLAATTTTTNAQTVVLMPDVAAEQRTIAFQANAKLCRLVRKCPWMYDRNHHNYAKKHILDKSWCKIARECNDSVASCKERWRNIRAAFARSINIYKTHSGPNRVKPYYLHKELSFLVKPMMEGRDKKDEFDDTNEGVKDEEGGGGNGGAVEEEELEEEEEEDPADEEDFPDDTAEIKSAFEALNPDIRIHAETRYQKMLRNNNNNNNDFESSGIFEPHTEFTTSDAENEFNFPDDTLSQAEAERRVAHMINNHNNSNNNINNGLKRPMHLETETFDTKRFKLSQTMAATASENDIRFLEALLPDMALMNTRQKIIFKRKIYQTLEEVFEKSNDFPNIEHNTPKIELPKKELIYNKIEHNTTPTNIANSFTPSTIAGGAQVRQTVLTVNSSTARNLINNIANLNESELQKVNGFLQNSLRTPNNNTRLHNGTNTPSSAAAKLMSSTPKITITKVSCPPPASLRHLTITKPPSPSPATVTTTIHNPAAAVISSNVHSTTSSYVTNAVSTQNKNPLWNQLLPITIKDEIEDVDID